MQVMPIDGRMESLGEVMSDDMSLKTSNDFTWAEAKSFYNIHTAELQCPPGFVQMGNTTTTTFTKASHAALPDGIHLEINIKDCKCDQYGTDGCVAGNCGLDQNQFFTSVFGAVATDLQRPTNPANSSTTRDLRGSAFKILHERIKTEYKSYQDVRTSLALKITPGKELVNNFNQTAGVQGKRCNITNLTTTVGNPGVCTNEATCCKPPPGYPTPPAHLTQAAGCSTLNPRVVEWFNLVAATSQNSLLTRDDAPYEMTSKCNNQESEGCTMLKALDTNFNQGMNAVEGTCFTNISMGFESNVTDVEGHHISNQVVVVITRGGSHPHNPFMLDMSDPAKTSTSGKGGKGGESGVSDDPAAGGHHGRHRFELGDAGLPLADPVGGRSSGGASVKSSSGTSRSSTRQTKYSNCGDNCGTRDNPKALKIFNCDSFVPLLEARDYCCIVFTVRFTHMAANTPKCSSGSGQMCEPQFTSSINRGPLQVHGLNATMQAERITNQTTQKQHKWIVESSPGACMRIEEAFRKKVNEYRLSIINHMLENQQSKPSTEQKKTTLQSMVLDDALQACLSWQTQAQCDQLNNGRKTCRGWCADAHRCQEEQMGCSWATNGCIQSRKKMK